MTRHPLDHELGRALHDLEQVSGALTVGSVVRPDVPRPVVRFLEGRLTALREVDDALRAADVAPGAETSAVTAYADRTLAIWRTALDVALAAAPPDDDEVARRRGGVAAVTGLLAAVGARD